MEIEIKCWLFVSAPHVMIIVSTVVSMQLCLVLVFLRLDTAGEFVIGVAESPVDMRSTLDSGTSHAVDIYWALRVFVVLWETFRNS